MKFLWILLMLFSTNAIAKKYGNQPINDNLKSQKNIMLGCLNQDRMYNGKDYIWASYVGEIHEIVLVKNGGAPVVWTGDYKGTAIDNFPYEVKIRQTQDSTYLKIITEFDGIGLTASGKDFVHLQYLPRIDYGVGIRCSTDVEKIPE